MPGVVFCPPAMAAEEPLRARQREWGVDMDCVERGFECQEALLDEIAATRAALHV